MNYMLILIVVIVVSVLAMILFLASRYKKCPSDKLLVVYGKTDGGSARVYHGGGSFIWPIIQAYSFLDLEPMTIKIPLEGALSKQNIRIDVPSTFTVAISTDESIRKNAAERLLGQPKSATQNLAENIIFGQLRLVIATMDIEEINANRDKFLNAITENLEKELTKVGLHLINSNIQDIHDDSGYLEALGKKAAAGAINEAKVQVAEKNRDGDIGETNANTERAIQTANLRAESEIGQAKAAKNSKIGQADADAKARAETAKHNSLAVEGENTAAVHIANTTSERNVKEAEARKLAVIAENVTRAKAQEETYKAEKIAEDLRAMRDESTQYADVIVPAEIAKKKIEVDADATAEEIMRVAKGNAIAVLVQKEAEGAGIKAVFKGQAEGFAQLVKSAGSSELAIQMMITEQLPELMRIQVDAIKNLKIDKIVVWDGMGGNKGDGTGTGSTTSDWIQSLLKCLPAYDELYKMTGNKLPGMLDTSLNKKGKDVEVEDVEVLDKETENKPPSDEKSS